MSISHPAKRCFLAAILVSFVLPWPSIGHSAEPEMMLLTKAGKRPVVFKKSGLSRLDTALTVVQIALWINDAIWGNDRKSVTGNPSGVGTALQTVHYPFPVYFSPGQSFQLINVTQQPIPMRVDHRDSSVIVHTNWVAAGPTTVFTGNQLISIPEGQVAVFHGPIHVPITEPVVWDDPPSTWIEGPLVLQRVGSRVFWTRSVQVVDPLPRPSHQPLPIHFNLGAGNPTQAIAQPHDFNRSIIFTVFPAK